MIEVIEAVYTCQVFFVTVELLWEDKYTTKDWLKDLIPFMFLFKIIKEKL